MLIQKSDVLPKYQTSFLKEESRIVDELDEFLKYFNQAIIWYGNPKLIPVYLKMLKNIDLCLDMHQILLQFICENSKIAIKGYRLVEKWEEFEEKLETKFMNYDGDDYTKDYQIKFNKKALTVQKKIISFWEANQKSIIEGINMSQKYFYNKLFSPKNLLDDAIYSGVKEQLELTVKGISLLTGQYFAFDINAFVSKQELQKLEIEQWLNNNKEKFRDGIWYKPIKSHLVEQISSNEINIVNYNAEKSKSFIDDFLKS